MHGTTNLKLTNISFGTRSEVHKFCFNLFCNVLVCVLVAFVMCGFCNIWVFW